MVLCYHVRGMVSRGGRNGAMHQVRAITVWNTWESTHLGQAKFGPTKWLAQGESRTGRRRSRRVPGARVAPAMSVA